VKKKLLFLVISGSLITQVLVSGNPSRGTGKETDILSSETKETKADSLICFAEQFLGKPYHYACADPKSGFDCSGFVSYVFAHQGIALPRSSRDYERLGTPVSLDSCKKGDILVFTGTNASIRKAGHVGIVISGQGEPVVFIQSSSSKKQNGVIISGYDDSPYYSKRFLKAVRVL
jgi:lipoprotein Spr